MTISNPLADNSPDHEDQSLVLRARSGDRQALEDLVQRHQAWIYNIAVRMLHHPQDAEDATQEILIKVLTRLASFEGRSSFRTWLYRIVVNHVLNMKRGRVEHASLDFAFYGAALDNTPELELADPKSASPDTDDPASAIEGCGRRAETNGVPAVPRAAPRRAGFATWTTWR